VAHACNPSYPGGGDQEDHSSKPTQGNSSQTLSQKTKQQQKTLSQKNCAGGVAEGEGPEFKPQYQKKKKGSIVKVAQSFTSSATHHDHFTINFTSGLPLATTARDSLKEET
jgi:hypothetical protein